MRVLLNLSNALYFLGSKHCGFGPQVQTGLNTVGGGGKDTHSNATNTQPNDTMQAWARSCRILPITALCLRSGLRLHKHFLGIRKHDLVKTQTGYNLPDVWTVETKENQRLVAWSSASYWGWFPNQKGKPKAQLGKALPRFRSVAGPPGKPTSNW